MGDKLKQLSVKKQKLDTFRPLPPELVKNLDEWFKVELTYSSNAIEGNTLTRAETALVVEKGITIAGKSLKEHLEATNHAQTLDFIKSLTGKKRQDLTEDDILDIHKIILKKIEDTYAGRYRNLPARLTGSTTILPNPVKIPQIMKDFVAWLTGENIDHPVKIAADAHFKLVTIHPFSDGNGRTARLLMNLLLMQQGYPITIIRKEDRISYINALEKAQVNLDLTDFYHLIYEAVNRSLDIYLEALEPERESNIEIPQEQRFYTTEEVAKIIKVDPESIRRYVRSKKLQAVKLGGKFIRIEKKNLDDFLEKLKT